MENLKNNILIAKFMGYEPAPEVAPNYYIKKQTGAMRANEMLYHSSWDWLMPVVEKIELLGNSVRIGSIFIQKNRVAHRCSIVGKRIVVNNSGSKIKAVYSAVVKFINNYKK